MRHEDGHVPLVLFTALAIAGAGVLAVSFLGISGAQPSPAITWTGLALLAAGMTVSAFHLGRRERAPFAMRGLWRSPISNEGALGALAAALGVVAASGVLGSVLGSGARIAAGIVALLFLGSIGLVYRLGGQVTWTGFSTLLPLSAGLACGAIAIDSVPPLQPVHTATLVCVAADAAIFAQRWRRIAQVAIDMPLVHGPWFDRRHELLAARFLLLDAVPCALLLAWPSPLAAVVAGAGLLVDRFGFYALAVQHRTELEIGRVERQLGPGAPPDV